MSLSIRNIIERCRPLQIFDFIKPTLFALFNITTTKRLATVVATALASVATAIPPVRDTGSAFAHVVAIKNGFGINETKTPVKVPFGKLTHVDLEITELDLRSVSISVPGASTPNASKITCQMYKDQHGIQPGSAQFTSTKPALISTNPVQFGWVLCYVNVNSS